MHLMIPGPVPVDPAVAARCAEAPSHVSPAFLEAMGGALGRMRTVWRAPATARPFVVAGGGTLAMEAAAANVVGPGDRVVVCVTGLFGDRMAEMLRRRGAEVVRVAVPPGEVPDPDDVASALAPGAVALFATHVDTSTGVRLDPAPLAALARAHGALSVFDGVCATAGETFAMEAWGADLYLTASQKALSVPPGLALWVASEAAMARRDALAVPPPLTFDLQRWGPIMEAYEARRPSYFSTPATGLVLGLATSLEALVAEGMDAVDARHARVASAMRAAWSALGLRLVARDGAAANTLSCLYLPDGVGAELLSAVAAEGVVVAGGLHPDLKARTFRVGHMGWATTRPSVLEATVRAVGRGLAAVGQPVDPEAGLSALREALG